MDQWRPLTRSSCDLFASTVAGQVIQVLFFACFRFVHCVNPIKSIKKYRLYPGNGWQLLKFKQKQFARWHPHLKNQSHPDYQRFTHFRFNRSDTEDKLIKVIYISNWLKCDNHRKQFATTLLNWFVVKLLALICTLLIRFASPRESGFGHMII